MCFLTKDGQPIEPESDLEAREEIRRRECVCIEQTGPNEYLIRRISEVDAILEDYVTYRVDRDEETGEILLMTRARQKEENGPQ